MFINKFYSFSLLSLVCLILIIGGCTDNHAVSLRYEAEKKLYQAEKANEKAGIKPELVTPEVMEQIENLYTSAADFSLAALDSVDQTQNPVEYHELQYLAFQATNRIAQIFHHNRHYTKTITILKRLLAATSLQPLQKLTTQINLGSALQASGYWDSALVIYNSVIEEYYPPTDENDDVLLTLINLPAHIYRVEKLTGDSSTATDKLEWALKYYNDLATSFPGTKLEAVSRGNLIRLYDQTGQWEEEIDQLSLLLDSTSSNYLSIRIKIADLYGTYLKQPKRALRLYSEITEGLNDSDSLIYPIVQYKIALVQMEEENYTEARRIVIGLKSNYRRYFASNPMAQYLVARSFELGGNWSRAEVEYRFLIENYRGSDEAMSALLYVAKYLEEEGRTQESKHWYQEAEKYYKEIAATGSGTIKEAKALAYQAELFGKQENWSGAAQQLTHLFERFPETEPGHRALLRASDIYKNKLGDTATADSLVEIFRTSISEITNTQEK